MVYLAWFLVIVLGLVADHYRKLYHIEKRISKEKQKLIDLNRNENT